MANAIPIPKPPGFVNPQQPGFVTAPQPYTGPDPVGHAIGNIIHGFTRSSPTGGNYWAQQLHALDPRTPTGAIALAGLMSAGMLTAGSRGEAVPQGPVRVQMTPEMQNLMTAIHYTTHFPKLGQGVGDPAFFDLPGPLPRAAQGTTGFPGITPEGQAWNPFLHMLAHELGGVGPHPSPIPSAAAFGRLGQSFDDQPNFGEAFHFPTYYSRYVEDNPAAVREALIRWLQWGSRPSS